MIPPVAVVTIAGLVAAAGCATRSRVSFTNHTRSAVQALTLTHPPADEVVIRRDWPNLRAQMVTVPAGATHVFEERLFTSKDKVGFAVAGPGIRPDLFDYAIVMLPGRCASVVLEEFQSGVVLRLTEPASARLLPRPPFWLEPDRPVPAPEAAAR